MLVTKNSYLFKKMNMLMRRWMLAAWTIAAMVCVADAAPRSEADMRQAALAAIERIGGKKAVTKSGAPALRKVAGREWVAVYEAGGRGFAVVSADDAAPAVLGYSSGKASATGNPAFAWWLGAMNEAVANAARQGLRLAPVKPDPDKFKPEVPPLCVTEWGQEAPYNNRCPIVSGEDRCLTGCVATSIGQVLYYHGGPAHGYGRRTIYYPQYDVNGTAIYVDFDNEVFDWNNILPTYKDGYTAAQADAVASLMRALGVAVNMNYGGGASGAYHTDAADGLKVYLGIEGARRVDRSAYTDTEWMNLLFDQLSNGLPVVYGGADVSMGGHSFVLDGYDSEGLMHVNWGWYGDENGYFDLSMLAVRNYIFSMGQDAIVDIDVDEAGERVQGDFTLDAPGTLEQRIDPARLLDYDVLRVAGPVNGDDIRLIRTMAGRDGEGNRTDGRLRELDLADAEIVGGGGPYLTEGGTGYFTANGELGDKMFYGCSLADVKLPTGITSFGDGVLALCTRLASVQLAQPEDGSFVVVGDVVYNRDTTELIAVLPSFGGNIRVERGVVSLHDYALAGCNHLKNVTLASTVQAIGRECFHDCIGLESIKTYSKSVPRLTGPDVFKGVTDPGVKLYVPRGTGDAYASAEQWSVFATLGAGNIVEFGTTIKARNAMREVGQDNPAFSYQVIGDYVEGRAELTCDADRDSPAGQYVIRVLPGTITEEGVEYVDGILYVTEPSGIDAVQAGGGMECFDIYAPDGTCVRRGATTTDDLPRGVYIINGRKRVAGH